VVVGILLIAAIAAAGALTKQPETMATIHWLNANDSSGSAEIEQIADDGLSVFSIASGASGAYSNKMVLQKWTESGTVSRSVAWAATNSTCQAMKITISGDKVFVLGKGEDLQGRRLVTLDCFPSDLSVVPLWARSFDLGFGKTYSYAMEVYGGQLFIAGSARNSEGGISAMVAAFDAGNGTLLWTYEVAGIGEGNQFYDVAADASGVYATGYQGSSDGYSMLIVSLSPSAGSRLWDFRYEGGGNHTCPAVIEVKNGQVIAAGYMSLANGTAWAINCGLNGVNGAVLWESFDYSGGSIGTDSRMVSGNVLISGLWHGKFYAGSFKVDSGARNWLDSIAITGEANYLTAMDLEGQRLVVAYFDMSVNSTGSYLWKMMVRAYDQNTGAVLQTEMEAGTDATSDGVCLNVLKGSIYASTGVVAPAASEGASAEQTNSVVTTDGYKILVNGEELLIKGVNYAPTPIGTNPDYDPWGDYFYDDHNWQDIWNRDLPAIKAMNANTIKLYGMTSFMWDGGDPQKQTKFHKQFYQALHNLGLYVIPMVWFSVDWMNGNEPKDPYHVGQLESTKMYQAWKFMVAEAKDYPAVIGYCVGNEVNPGTSWNSHAYWMDRYYPLVSHVKDLDPKKITMISLQDDNDRDLGTKEINQWNDQMPRLDVWGVCVYRAKVSESIGLTDIFQTYAANTANNQKPLVISEFGAPASTHVSANSTEAVLLPDNANATGQYIKVCWTPGWRQDDIMSNNAYNGSTDCKVCAGGFVFEWTDEWVKGDKQAWDHSGSATDKHTQTFPGGYWDEKWFGINGVSTDRRAPDHYYNPLVDSPDVLQVRAAYYLLRSMWA
jgi:hypothetical protein